MARGGWYVVRRRGGQTQYSSTSLKHHTPRGEGWSQDGVAAARARRFAQRGGRRKLSARRGGQILRRSGTGGSLSVMVEGRSGPNARNTRFALVGRLPEPTPALDPAISGRHPLAVGVSRVQRDQQWTTGVQRAPKSRSDGLGPPPAVGEPCGGVRGRRQGPRAAAGGRAGWSEGVGGREAGWLHGLGVGRRSSRCLNAVSQGMGVATSLNARSKVSDAVGNDVHSVQ